MTPQKIDRRLWQLGVVLSLLWLTLILGSLRAYTFEFDSANYSLGVQHYNVGLHQPHPPGYPLWIVASKVTAAIVGDVRIAQTLLAALFAIAAVAVFFILAREILGDWGAFAAAGFLAFSPPVLLYSSVQDTYTVDLFASCAIAWLVVSRLEGFASRLGFVYVAAALLAGFRLSAILFLTPILMVLAVAAIRQRLWGALCRGILQALLMGAVWFVPTAILIGGVSKWNALNNAQSLSGARASSILYGAPAGVYWNMVGNASVQLALALFAASLLTLLWIAFGRGRADRMPPAPARKWDTWWFYLLWAAPCLLFDFLVHCPKPGYLLLSLPPLVLLLMKAMRLWILRRAGSVENRQTAWFWTLVAGVSLSLALAYAPLPSSSFEPWHTVVNAASLGRPEFAHDVEEGHHELQHLLGSATDDSLVFALRPSNEAPNYRTLAVDFPHMHVAAVLGKQPTLITGVQAQPLGELPSRLKTIYWLTWPDIAPDEVRAAFPQTMLVLRNQLFALWRTDLGANSLDETLLLYGTPVRLHRMTNVSLLSPVLQAQLPKVALAQGFGDLEGDESPYWVWAMGPAATLSVRFPDNFTKPLTIAFRVRSAMPGAAGRMLVNGKPDRMFDTFTNQQVIQVMVPPEANPGTVTFEFDRWNGHPAILVPADSRPMAVMFESIRVQAGGTEYEVLGR